MDSSWSRFALVALLACLLAVLMAGPAVAQKPGDPFKIGTWTELESEILGENRRLVIGLPNGYEKSDQSYPVLYLLDGPYHFPHVQGLARFMASTDVLPGMIVVGVGNTDRMRDMTPPLTEPDPTMPAERYATAGGVDNFLRFFAEELIPHIDETYRTTDYRVLVGHSLGGLVGVHSVVHANGLFDGIVGISPSLQWDGQRLVRQFETFMEDIDEPMNVSLYLTSGSEGGGLTGGILKIAGVLEEKAPRGFIWDYRIMPEENHGTVVYRSTRQGLEFIFRHWNLRTPIDLYDRGGLDAIEAHFQTGSERYGVERRPNQSTMAILVGDLIKQERFDEALTVLEYDPEQYPPGSIWYNRIATGFRERGEPDRELDCLIRAIKANPTDRKAADALVERGENPAKYVTIYTVEPAVLKRYVGSFRGPDDGDPVVVTSGDNELKVGGTPMGEITIVPESEHRFVASVAPIAFVFIVGEDGSVEALELQRDGKTFLRYEREK